MTAKPESKTASTQYHENDFNITESSKVIIAREPKSSTSSQAAHSPTNSQNSQRSTAAQKKQTQPITNPKPKPPVVSDRVKKGSEDPIQKHNKFGPLADDGDMDTDESAVRPGARGSRPRSPVKAPK